jgi:hypothetical protein
LKIHTEKLSFHVFRHSCHENGMKMTNEIT